jgi:rod shape determining protein RodA
VIACFVIIAVPAALIARQPDLGTALLVTASGFFVLFLAGLPWWFLGIAITGVAAIAPVHGIFS